MRLEKYKVLFILHFPPPIHGPALVGKYIKESAKINNNFNCTYVNLSTSKNVSEKGKGAFKKAFLFARLYFNIFSCLKKNNFDICYLTINSKGAAFYKEMVVVLLLKAFNCKIVYHYHNKGISEKQNNGLLNCLYHLQFKNAKAILLSPLLYSDVSKYLSRKQIYYCPNGIPISKSNFDLINRRIKNNSGSELLFLSHLMKEKGVYILLEALKILQNKGVGFKANFIGDWMNISEKEFNNFVVLNNLEANVFYLGKKYGDEKRMAFESADIFVLPTLNDCFPLVILESMQYGLPVITTIEGAIPEIVENGVNGYTISKNDSTTLAERIEFLINNRSKSLQMGQKGYQLFKEKYTLPIFENNFVKILKQISDDFELECKPLRF
jgi:glycosyltransferase involved in cell wall biosynthesis